MEFIKSDSWFVRSTNPTCKAYSSLRTWRESFEEGLYFEKSVKIIKTHEGKEWLLISERKGREIPHFGTPTFWMILTWECDGKKMREEYNRSEGECWLSELEKCYLVEREML